MAGVRARALPAGTRRVELSGHPLQRDDGDLRAILMVDVDADGTLETVVYTTPDGAVTKTLGYASGQLVTLTLSGALPSGIDTVKTLVYAGDSLASVSYF